MGSRKNANRFKFAPVAVTDARLAPQNPELSIVSDRVYIDFDDAERRQRAGTTGFSKIDLTLQFEYLSFPGGARRQRQLRYPIAPDYGRRVWPDTRLYRQPQ